MTAAAGATLPAQPHTTISQYYGQLLYAAAPGVGHHGGHCCHLGHDVLTDVLFGIFCLGELKVC
jgi:hypothetical protein